jgi:hypothetical protein
LFAEVEQSSYEDDLQILRVIEAYCTSKQRQTITNSGGPLLYPRLGPVFILVFGCSKKVLLSTTQTLHYY